MALVMNDGVEQEIGVGENRIDVTFSLGDFKARATVNKSMAADSPLRVAVGWPGHMAVTPSGAQAFQICMSYATAWAANVEANGVALYEVLTEESRYGQPYQDYTAQVLGTVSSGESFVREAFKQRGLKLTEITRITSVHRIEVERAVA
jgi:hypothetical protein